MQFLPASSLDEFGSSKATESGEAGSIHNLRIYTYYPLPKIVLCRPLKSGYDDMFQAAGGITRQVFCAPCDGTLTLTHIQRIMQAIGPGSCSET